jgi:hypothetical protein
MKVSTVCGLAASGLLLMAIAMFQPAIAADRDCAKEIQQVAAVAAGASDAEKKAEAKAYLERAHDELVQEQDAKECLENVDAARELLGS